MAPTRSPNGPAASLAVELDAARFSRSRFRSGRAIGQGRSRAHGRRPGVRRHRREPARGRRRPEEWNWEALAKLLNTRWKLNVRDRELKKLERDAIAEMVIEQAREAIEEVDLSEGARFLDEDFGVRTACGWVHYKFGISSIRPKSASSTPKPSSGWCARRRPQAYEERETEYPVMAGLYHFTTAGRATARSASTAKRWWPGPASGSTSNLDVDDLKNRQRDEIRGMLVEHSRR